jgi:hypothetical protein
MARLDPDAVRAEVEAVCRELESARARLRALRRQVGRTRGFRRDDRGASEKGRTGRLYAWAGRLDEANSALALALRELRGIARRGET